jgi:hypothetical protein
VGATEDVDRRLIRHGCLEVAEQHARATWIRALRADDVVPQLTVVETVDGDGWADAERKWIAHFRQQGCDLLNRTDGGPGVPGWKPTPEQIENRRRFASYQRSPETRARMSVAMKARGKPAWAFVREACPVCGLEMSRTNLSRHVKARHADVAQEEIAQ